MKKTNIIVSATALTLTLSLSVVAHQISGEEGHGSNWNWNNSSHTHDSATVASRRSGSVENPVIIRGTQSLDGIAKVGECYTSAYVEPSCKVEIKKVLIKESYDETEVVPAVTKEVERKVMVSPERILEEYIPALYETISKKVLIEPARTEWKKGNFTKITKTVDNETYCLVEIPARYENKVEKVLKVPAATKTRVIPAVYKTYMETIVVAPATTRVVQTYPAVYKAVEECVNKTAGRYEWRSILCEQNATKSVLTAIEQALADAGSLISVEVDGEIDNVTERAIKDYQRKSGLKIDGLVNIDTVESLGVKYK